MSAGAGLCLPEQKGAGAQTLTPSAPSCPGTRVLSSVPRGWRGRIAQSSSKRGENTSPGTERGPGLSEGGSQREAVSRSTQRKLFLHIFFFKSLAPLLGAQPADTDGVLQNRAKRQEREEQSYL